jgi:hypothetical protein
MAFEWREYLTLAQWLQTNPLPGISQEAAFRCAIGRAYYSAFGHAVKYATDFLGFIPRYDGDDHGRLRAHLKKKRRQKVSEALDRLREWRNHCDYDAIFAGDVAAILTNSIAESLYVFVGLTPPLPHP